MFVLFTVIPAFMLTFGIAALIGDNININI